MQPLFVHGSSINMRIVYPDVVFEKFHGEVSLVSFPRMIRLIGGFQVEEPKLGNALGTVHKGKKTDNVLVMFTNPYAVPCGIIRLIKFVNARGDIGFKHDAIAVFFCIQLAMPMNYITQVSGLKAWCE